MGGSTNVVLRGYKSLVNDNQALFVIDGVPFDNSNNNTSDQRTGRGGFDYGSASADVNPDDIASISVLKGPAATALYGERGFNGVILITTKKGRKGGLGVTVNAGVTTGSIDKSTFAKYQHEYGANYGSAIGYGSPDGNFLYFDVNGDGVDDLVTPTTEDASWGAKFDPNLLVYQWDAFDKSSPNYHKATPWVAAKNDPTTFFEKPFGYNTSVFVDGGNDKAIYKLGYTRNDDKGILPNSRITKDLVNFSGTVNLTDRLSAGASINYSHIAGLGRYGTGYDPSNPMTNFRQWWETNVDLKEQKDAYFRTKENTTWNWADPSDEASGLIPIYWNNPYFDRYESYETDERGRYFGNVNVNYKATSWLNIMGRVSLDSYDEFGQQRYAIGSIGVSTYSRINRSFKEYNYDLLLNFNKDITRDLNFKGLLGSTIRKTNVSYIAASTNGGLILPHFFAIANSVNAPEAPTEYQSQIEVDGFYAGATFTYRKFITLDGTIRRDQSSTLPEENNTYYYPSVSLGFVYSELLKNQTWLSYGKLRASYAEVGHSAPAYYVYDTYSLGTPIAGNPVASASVTKRDPFLRPERNKSYEFGMEASFLHNRLGFDITYYHSQAFDQITPVSISSASGYTTKILNAGTIQNSGVELSINATPVKTRDFSWDFTVNWTRNRNKVVALFDTAKNLQIASFQGGVSLNATLGQPYGTIRGSDFVYTADGSKTVRSNGYYQISSASNNVIGDANPDWTGSFANTLRYKNFALNFLIDVRQGGDIFSLDMYYGLATGLYPETAGLNDLGNPVRNTIADGGGFINKGETADGKENTKRVDVSNLFGAYGYYRNPAKAFVYDASFVKLREVGLTYSFPKEFLGKSPVFKGVDVSVVGRNLWIIHKNLPYADPEDIISSGNAALGYQGGAYPAVRTFAFNVKLRF
jgi:TonB-linked SusC/RagA family outer membrane protein